MDKTDRLRDYGLAFLLYEQGLGLCGYELIRELFIFIKLILNSYLYTCLYYIYLPIFIMYTWVRFHKTVYYIYSSVLLIETLNALQRRFFWLQRLSENRLNFSYMSNPRPRAIVQPVSVLIRRSWSALKS